MSLEWNPATRREKVLPREGDLSMGVEASPMHDPNMVDRRITERRKSIPLSTAPSSYVPNARYLVIPDDLSKDFKLCNAIVDSLDGYGAWLSGENPDTLPTDDDILLIEFQEDWVLTHHTRILKRENNRILVDAAKLTEREKSQLAPTTGRHDYRIKVNLPVRIKSTKGSEADSVPKLARLIDLSRGGMALVAPSNQPFSEGETITVRVVSWDHAVEIDAEVTRVTPGEEEGKQKLALQFPMEMSVRQRESVSTFIIQVQRRDALSRSLPTDLNEMV